MSATPKINRTPPVNRFEDYVLTQEVGPDAGLYRVKNTTMTYLPGLVGQPSQDDKKEYLSIGFVFYFNKNQYKNVLIATNGWMILVDDVADPVLDGTAMNDVFSPPTFGDTSFDSTTINDSFGSTKHVLLCPWFDDLKSVARVATSSAISTYLSALGLNANDISSGKTLTPPGVDSTMGGVKYHRGYSKDRGNCLVVRWKSYPVGSGIFNIVNFDVVLYESGDIEFRYAPRLLRGFDANEKAAIGIFANGESVAQPRYRDLVTFLGINDARGRNENGGATYVVGYTDASNGTKYNSSLNSYSNWPGVNKFGSIFRLTPPSLKRKQIRSIVSLRDSVPFAGNYTMFDDRNTIPFVTGTVEYPSMLPVNLKVDNESDQPQSVTRLFQSGSIRVTRVVKSGLYESPLFDSVVETNLRHK